MPHPGEGDGNAADGSNDKDSGGQLRHRRQSACAWPSSAYAHVVLTTAVCDGGGATVLSSVWAAEETEARRKEWLARNNLVLSPGSVSK